MKNYYTIFLFILGQCCITAQDTIVLQNLDDIVISATRLEGEMTHCPVSVTYTKVREGRGVQLFSPYTFLCTVPGVYLTNQYNSAQDLRLSVRGFGARSAFGIRGVRLMMDGIPLSTPDGQGQLDNVIVSGIESVEVLQGASSALYGNASGGVVSFKTFSDREEDAHSIRLGYGSFGNLQLSGRSHLHRDGLFMDHQLSYNQIQGFRELSASTNTIYNGRIKKVFTNNHEASFILNVLNSPRGEDPGGVNLETVEAQVSAARDRNLLFNTGEELNQITAGGNVKWFLSDNNHIKLNSFFTRRDFSNRLPFENGGQVALLRNYGGGDLTYNHNFSTATTKLELLAGISYMAQQDSRVRFKNVEGERGEETLNQLELFNNVAAFTTLQASRGRSLLNVGLRYDRNNIRVEDGFPSNGLQSGSTELPSWSPSLAYSYRLAQGHFLRASFSYGFETPTLSELGNRPDGMGGFNLELRPQQSYNYEVGYRAAHLETFRTSLALFAVTSTDELLPYEVEAFPGRTFYRNSGETRRLGVELSAELQPMKNLYCSLSYTYSDFTFSDFEEFTGNVLPGIPRHNAVLEVNYNLAGWNITANSNFYSSLFADSGNEAEVPAYTFTTLSLARKIGRVLPYVGVNNVFNAAYYDNIRINAFGMRFYEGAPPRNYYIGVKFDF